jgi:hypothetical protein
MFTASQIGCSALNVPEDQQELSSLPPAYNDREGRRCAVLQGMLWIFGIYGLCVVMVHAVHMYMRRCGKLPAKKHYVLVSSDNQLQMEWYLRSLILFSWLRGIEIRITILDEGSTDDTLAIVERLSVRYPIEIKVVRSSLHIGEYVPCRTGGQDEAEVIVVRLNVREDLAKMPLLL